jgi:hypothetical protein
VNRGFETEQRVTKAHPAFANSPAPSCERLCRYRRSANYYRRRRCLKITHSFGTTPPFRSKPIPALDKIPQISPTAFQSGLCIMPRAPKMRLRRPSIVRKCFTRNISVRFLGLSIQGPLHPAACDEWCFFEGLIVSKSADDPVTPPLKLGITSFLTACSPRPQKSYRFAALENIEQQA